MNFCKDCGYYYQLSYCFNCESKLFLANFWNKPVRPYKAHNNNLVKKPEILTSDQEAQVSRLVNTYGMDRDAAITSLKKFWDNQKL